MDLEKEFKLIKQGAEARLYKGIYLGRSTLVKERFPKRYRHTLLDDAITKDRMKAESRVILRCKTAGIHTPALYLVNLERRRIYMEYVENSITAKEYIIRVSEAENVDYSSLNQLAEDIGKILGKMHVNNIIHGDLTTSNMLLVHEETKHRQIFLIDFGLSHVDSSAEDKAVDLYVLERALLSTHSCAERIFPILLQHYAMENEKGSEEVLKKLEEVRSRGRKRTMVG